MRFQGDKMGCMASLAAASLALIVATILVLDTGLGGGIGGGGGDHVPGEVKAGGAVEWTRLRQSPLDRRLVSREPPPEPDPPGAGTAHSAVPEVGADIRGAVASLYQIDGKGQATMAMDWRRCGESEWLGQQPSAGACAAAVLALPSAECSHSVFNYVAHRDGNCACAPPGAYCEVPAAGSYYAGGTSGCDPKLDFVRSLLCGAGVAPALAAAANAGDPGWIVQIGAHVGFEDNDPIAEPLLELFADAPRSRGGAAGRWMLVEASPTNFARLVQNVAARRRDADYITFLPVNMGVSGPPDPATAAAAAAGGGERQENMTFYGISSDVDVDTGRDSRSGKDIPTFVTQMGSFDRGRVLRDVNAIRAFSRHGW